MNRPIPPNGKLTRAITTILIALAISFITATTSWLVILSQNNAAIDVRMNAVENRIQSLETGRTTPMAAETRAEFNAVWRELEKIEKAK